MPNHTPPQLFLVDGFALIFRAFFALISRPLRTAKGENTSAAWGITNFLLRLREKYRPDYLVWVNDAGDSFRTVEYPEYKSTREKLDDELQADFDTAVDAGDAAARGLRHSAGQGGGLRGRRRDRYAGRARRRQGPADGDRLRRQGLLPAHPPRRLAAQPRPRRPRRRGRGLGRHEQRAPSASASHRIR